MIGHRFGSQSGQHESSGRYSTADRKAFRSPSTKNMSDKPTDDIMHIYNIIYIYTHKILHAYFFVERKVAHNMGPREHAAGACCVCEWVCYPLALLAYPSSNLGPSVCNTKVHDPRRKQTENPNKRSSAKYCRESNSLRTIR